MATRDLRKFVGSAENEVLPDKAFGLVGLEDTRPTKGDSSSWAQKVAQRPGKEAVIGPENDGLANVGLKSQKGSARDLLKQHVNGASSSSKIPCPKATGNGRDKSRAGNEAPKFRNGDGQSGNTGGSWADKVRASSAKSRFTLDNGFVHEHGAAEYSLPDELIEDNFEDWTRCLVGFVPGFSFPFHAARSIALREWKHYGIESVTSYEGFFLFRFHNEEKLQEVLADGPWLFGGKYMMLQQWHTCFVFDKSKIDKVPVWIRLKGLPFTLWTHKALSFVASIVGKPLACDRATFERSRLSFARVCVEVDASKAFVHNFSLKCKLSNTPIKIGVEYEWKPKRCSKCCVYGHNCETARKVEVQSKVDVTKRTEIVEPTDRKLGLIDALALISKPVNYSATIPKGTDDRENFQKGDKSYGTEMAEEEMQALIQRIAESSVGKEQTGPPSVPEIAGHVFPGTEQDDERGILTTWERKELDNLGLIPMDLEDLSSIGESTTADSIEDQGVLRVDPLMVIGAAENNCRFNQSASLDGSSATSGQSILVRATEHHSWADLSGDGSCSSKPHKKKKKGKPKKGGQLPSHSNPLQSK